MNFLVIIPVSGAGDKIERTLRSIINQIALVDRTVTLSCIVIDGSSDPLTFASVEKFQDERITLISEPDNSMYDGLAKGLARAKKSDVTCYLSAGEEFSRTAFSVVQQVFSANPNIKWVTGQQILRNALLEVTESRLPHPYKNTMIQCGYHGTVLPAIQQESTFWRSHLNEDIDLSRLAEFRLAGDFYLWFCFSRSHRLWVIDTQLSSFTIEPGQLSHQVPNAYRDELLTICNAPRLIDRLTVRIEYWKRKYLLPPKKARGLIRYNYTKKVWLPTK